ncbi:MAG: nucleotidyltransferase domain-containing protein [Eubacteriales bacterium]|nr:nucleotidyltransferase domain-containing protein [Eubacteriales bacterium]
MPETGAIVLGSIILCVFWIMILYAIIKSAVRNAILEADYIRENTRIKREKNKIEKINNLQSSIDLMIKRIKDILGENMLSVYLYGSVSLGDFRLGWSDIDILCLCKSTITDEQANKLLNLRQVLLAEYPGNSYFRLFEGGFLTEEAFINKTTDRVVYWGTSGQKITDSYYFDAFSMAELKDYGMVSCGEDRRKLFAYPTREELTEDIKRLYDSVRKNAQTTQKNISNAGWMLDIARCLYTLKTGNIIAKTASGEWVIENKLVPDIKIMERVVKIRKNPNKFKQDKKTLDWVAALGPHIQKFADVLESELNQNKESN